MHNYIEPIESAVQMFSRLKNGDKKKNCHKLV